MADIRKVRVMISSRSTTTVFGDRQLSDVRRDLQIFVEGIRWYARQSRADGELVGRDQSLFDTWIHENDPGEAADESTLEISLRQIRWADLVLVLYTGEAGSASFDSAIGICHAELQEAMSRRPEIVSIINVLPLKTGTAKRDAAFREYVKNLNVHRIDVASEAELRSGIAEMLQQRVSVLVGRGATIGGRKRDRGQALDWSRLDLAERQQAMRTALAEYISDQSENLSDEPVGLHVAELPTGRIALRLDAIPAALGVAAAREGVGQPFLRDHLHVATLKKLGVPGIVHLIACHRGVTETQAARILGTPDAVSVSSDFGVYIADHAQKIQMVFLAECSDETATGLAVRRFLEWLALPGEGVGLLQNARSRRRILEAIAREQPAESTG